MFLPSLREGLSQGDVIDRVTVLEPVGKGSGSHTARVVVLSHDCEMVKPDEERARYVLVVEMRTPADAGPSNWGHIKAGRVWNALYIPAGSGVPEGYVDLGRVHRVAKAALETACADGRRLASMDDDGREALIYALASYLLRQEIPPTP